MRLMKLDCVCTLLLETLLKSWALLWTLIFGELWYLDYMHETDKRYVIVNESGTVIFSQIKSIYKRYEIYLLL